VLGTSGGASELGDVMAFRAVGIRLDDGISEGVGVDKVVLKAQVA
jgi:hypothetical protein